MEKVTITLTDHAVAELAMLQRAMVRATGASVARTSVISILLAQAWRAQVHGPVRPVSCPCGRTDHLMLTEQLTFECDDCTTYAPPAEEVLPGRGHCDDRV